MTVIVLILLPGGFSKFPYKTSLLQHFDLPIEPEYRGKKKDLIAETPGRCSLLSI